ncbi:MAG TPA: hypothetical protein VNJ08_01690 [Bacteriovoracaceae bacterium]|nr:hypothetical protein [Bacteriovoracaceae bacterium]
MKKLHTPYPASDVSYTYGGWGLEYRNWAGGPVLTHNGSNTVNYAVTWVAPKKGLILMSATNYGGVGASDATNEAIDQMIIRVKNLTNIVEK